MRGRRCPAEGGEAVAFVPSDAVHGFWKRGEGRKCAFLIQGWLVERERKCEVLNSPLLPPTLCVSYLWKLMSDGLTWDHPWQIEMTPRKTSQKSAFHLVQPNTNSYRAYRADVAKLWDFFFVAHLESSVSYCRNIYCSLFCGAEAKQYILKYNTLSVHFNVHKQGDCTHKSSLICVCRLPAYRHWSDMDFGSVPQHEVEGRHPFQKQTFILCNLDFFQWKHHLVVRLY